MEFCSQGVVWWSAVVRGLSGGRWSSVVRGLSGGVL